MKKYKKILSETSLFAGISEDEIETMLTCLGATQMSYHKGEYVFHAGDELQQIMVLVQGKLHIQKDDYWGNRTITNVVECGEIFGESYVTEQHDGLMNDVVAVEDSEIISFDVNRILSVCSSACRFHTLTVRNLFRAISEKNRKLMGKLGVISRRTTRDKLLTYLSEEAKKHGTAEFEIPFNRQQMADYLSVDRSAMSAELCKLRDEGLIAFEKSRFRLMRRTME